MSHVRAWWRLSFVGFVSFTSVACAAQTEEGDGGPSETADDPVAEVWNDSSDAIEIGYSEYFGGAIRYQKTREQLTARELTLLEDIQVIEPNDVCVSDGAFASVSVTTDGREAAYRARSLDATCNATDPYVGLEPVLQILATAGCRKDFQAGETFEAAPLVQANSGCYYPLHHVQGPRESWLTVYITEPGSYDFAFEGCGAIGPSQVTVYDEGGITERFSSTAPAGECPSFTVENAEEGWYPLRVVTESPSPDGATFYLRVNSSS